MRRETTESGGAFFAVSLVLALFLCFLTILIGVFLEELIMGSPSDVRLRQVTLPFVLLSLVFMEVTGAYHIGKKRLSEIGFSLLMSVILSNLAMLALPFFEIEYVRSPFTAVLIAVMQMVFLSVWAVVFHKLYYKVFPRRSAIVVANNLENAHYCADNIKRFSLEFSVEDMQCWSGFHNISEEISVIVAHKLEDNILVHLQKFCLDNNKELIIIPALFELGVFNSKSFQFGDLLALRFRPMGLSREWQFVKRLVDIVLSCCALIVLLIPIAIIAGIIFLQDKHNPFFSQERLTLNGRVFKLWKFRTMVPNAEQQSGPVLASFDDSRVTRFGRFLRRMRLDEVPQFWNSLIGDMSIVGPRPERPHFHTVYTDMVPEFDYRLSVKAGITGMAHVYGRYDTLPENRIKLDLYYIMNYSFLLDIKLMLETARIMFTHSYADGVREQDSQ